ncbi:MAG: hypothetical protein ACLPPF_04745 [Rhodomicrobium sp.]
MSIIPGNKTLASFGKVNVICHHILSSVQMIAIECHPFSIHAVVMACKELILNVAERENIFIEWDPKVRIKNEYYKQYMVTERKAYNYFKHADRDAWQPYDGPGLDDLRFINDVHTLFNIHGYWKITGTDSSGFSMFSSLMMVRYPELFDLDFMDAYPSLKEQYQRLDRTPESMLFALRTELFRTGCLPLVPPNLGSTMDQRQSDSICENGFELKKT